MARVLYRWDERAQQLVEIGGSGPVDAHFVIQDSMDPIEHPHTGELVDSKSRFEAINREHGLVNVSGAVGQRKRSIDWGTRHDFRDAIEKTYYDLRENRIPRYEGPPKEVLDILRKG